MKSSTGEHFIALDHVRALAAWLVFVWHFTHGAAGRPVPFEHLPPVFAFPFALPDEGHTGVALFMTLSGYLFSRLCEGRQLRFRPFLWNRFVRLAPLLAFVVALVGIRRVIDGGDLGGYLHDIALGGFLPTLPNGGWSITVEAHFYLLLPLLLWLLSRDPRLLLAVPLLAIALRFALHRHLGEIQTPAYGTLVGRIDQFVLGMLAARWRDRLARRHDVALGCALAFGALYWGFDRLGGFYGLGGYPSPSRLWIVLTTLEGLAYGTLIAWYDRSFAPSNTGVSAFIARLGEYSYSIYLLHGFVVFRAADFIHERVLDLSSFPVSLAVGTLLFCLMIIPGWLSYRFIEAPFLKLRRRNVYQPREGLPPSRPTTDLEPPPPGSKSVG